MRTHSLASRRSFLAGAGVAVLFAVAGCQGDGDGQGENSTEGENGSDGTETGDGTDENGETVELRGQQAVSETINADKEWEFEMSEGDVITVLLDSISQASVSGEIHQFERTSHLAEVTASSGNPDRMQYTVENEAKYIVAIDVRGVSDEQQTDVEIYIESG